MYHTRRQVSVALGSSLLAMSLAGQARVRSPEATATALVRVAQRLVVARAPYRDGGMDARGFDCSGLVWYVHRRVGVRVPRTAAQQCEAAQPVPREALMPGDLLFFKLSASFRERSGTGRVDHVGIYVDSDLFIHASLHRSAVSYELLQYFRPSIVSTGRFWA